MNEAAYHFLYLGLALSGIVMVKAIRSGKLKMYHTCVACVCVCVCVCKYYLGGGGWVRVERSSGALMNRLTGQQNMQRNAARVMDMGEAYGLRFHSLSL